MADCGAEINGDVDHAGIDADDGCGGFARGEKGLGADDDAFYVGLFGGGLSVVEYLKWLLAIKKGVRAEVDAVMSKP